MSSYFRSTESVHIAILHPRKLAVYNVSGMSNMYVGTVISIKKYVSPSNEGRHIVLV
jgi:hypothetical protein